MNSVPASQFKHTTAASLYDIPQKPRIVELFNDEQEGFVSIYYGNKAGDLRWPCRTVDMNAQGGDHGKSVVSAWMNDADVVRDFRTFAREVAP